jgi:hypothetical protein
MNGNVKLNDEIPVEFEDNFGNLIQDVTDRQQQDLGFEESDFIDDDDPLKEDAINDLITDPEVRQAIENIERRKREIKKLG